MPSTANAPIQPRAVRGFRFNFNRYIYRKRTRLVLFEILWQLNSRVGTDVSKKSLEGKDPRGGDVLFRGDGKGQLDNSSFFAQHQQFSSPTIPRTPPAPSPPPPLAPNLFVDTTALSTSTKNNQSRSSKRLWGAGKRQPNAVLSPPLPKPPGRSHFRVVFCVQVALGLEGGVAWIHRDVVSKDLCFSKGLGRRFIFCQADPTVSP